MQKKITAHGIGAKEGRKHEEDVILLSGKTKKIQGNFKPPQTGHFQVDRRHWGLYAIRGSFGERGWANLGVMAAR